MGANGRRYGFSGAVTGAAAKSIAGVVGTTAVRPWIYDLMISSVATPADNASEWQVRRFTAAGTASTATAQALDSGDPAAVSTSNITYTVEPTYSTGSLLDLAHNQRATVRWVAAPGSELIGPASATNGIGVQCIAVGGTGVSEICSVLFGE